MSESAIKIEAFSAEEHIELLSAQVISFLLPNSDKSPLFIEHVRGYHFEVGTLPQSRPDGQFRIFVYITCIVHFEDNQALKCDIHTECIFRALNAAEGTPFKLAEIPTEAMLAAISAAYSTTRGIFITRAAGTILQGAILPLLSPLKLMAKPEGIA